MMRQACTAAFMLLAALLDSGWAGMSACNSFARLSQDGMRILVMRNPQAEGDRSKPFTIPDGRAIDIRDTFPKSGVYDSSTLHPIWQVDWSSLENELRWSADFSDLVRLNIHGLDSDWALRFYNEGRLVKSYPCTYLLTRLRNHFVIPFSTWDSHFEWYDHYELEGSRLLVSTVPRQLHLWGHTRDLQFQEVYTFDLHTGAVLSRRIIGESFLWRYAGAGAAALVLLALMIGMWVRRGRGSFHVHKTGCAGVEGES